MTDSTTFVKTQGEHGARLDQLEKDKTAIFDIHNKLVAPAIADIKVISQNVKDTSEILASLKKDVKEYREEQIRCQAARDEAARAESKGMNTTQKVGVWVGIITGICTFLAGVGVGVYKLLKMFLTVGS